MAVKPVIPNVWADRYASPEMIQVWSPEGKTLSERRLWVAVLRAQEELGIETPEGAVSDYESVLDNVDLDSIRRRERETRHDVKAKIEEFNALAGCEVIHRGMTSRDLTDNVEQQQIMLSLRLVRDRAVAVIFRLARLAADNCDLVVSGKTHNVPAQITTFGKRLASAGEELILAFEALECLIRRYPLRGLKGPVGTSQDQLDLLGGNVEKLIKLEQMVANSLGFSTTLNSVGQIYPRSLDWEVLSTLVQMAAGPSSLATTFRLMAGDELFSEGFKKGQTGSSAMPHKINARTCERINGINDALQGYAVMVSSLSGHQWQEGDVSCSVVRRVALPDSFMAIDGLFESFLTVLAEMGVYPAVMEQELDQNLPFLATTKILVAAVKNGAGRETVHQAIKEHAVSVVRDNRESGGKKNNLLELLAADERIPLTSGEINKLIKNPIDFVGDATGQVRRFLNRASALVLEYPDAVNYQPGEIL